MTKSTRVLIGHDGSASCDEAIEDLKFAGLPRRLDAVVLTAAEDFIPPAVKGFGLAGLSPAQMKSWQNQSMAQARDVTDRAAKRVRALFPYWNVRTELSAESPIRAILNEARRWKSDVIVLGARGRTPYGRFIGSVSQLVLTQAGCSVRIGRLRPGKTSAEARIAIGLDGSAGSDAAVEAVKNRAWPAKT